MKIRSVFIILFSTLLLINFMSKGYALDDIKLINVPYINQDNIVSGCEAVSATMLLQFYGYDISETDFADKYLIKKDWVIVDGKRYGPDPSFAYPGNPYIVSGLNCGYGCYSPCIEKSINNFLKQTETKGEKSCSYTAKSVQDVSLEDVVKKYINNGCPVLMWATMDMKPLRKGNKWLINYTDENSSYHIDDEFIWTAGEHCLVLVGYDNDNYWFNDPYKNYGLIKYDKKIVETRFKEMGEQIVVLEKANN